jgi:ABC-type uncharacterized transport system substrate-binding protein
MGIIRPHGRGTDLKRRLERRKFLSLLGGAAVSGAHGASAQMTGKRYRVAILTTEASGIFIEELGRAGFVVGRNLDVDGRGIGVPSADFDRVAVELAQARPDVLVAFGPEAIRAAQRSTQSIPIQGLADDMLGSKLVTSMPHPEGNTTGVAIFAYQLDVKRLELLHEVVPMAKRMAVFADNERIRNIEALKSAALAFDIEIAPFFARTSEDVGRVIDTMKGMQVEAVNILASPILWGFRQLIRERLDLHGLPAIWQWPEGAEAGGLIAYGPRLRGIFRQCADQVAELLRGAKVAETPVEQPTEFELTINVKTARALGIQITPTLLSRADKTLE